MRNFTVLSYKLCRRSESITWYMILGIHRHLGSYKHLLLYIYFFFLLFSFLGWQETPLKGTELPHPILCPSFRSMAKIQVGATWPHPFSHVQQARHHPWWNLKLHGRYPLVGSGTIQEGNKLKPRQGLLIKTGESMTKTDGISVDCSRSGGSRRE